MRRLLLPFAIISLYGCTTIDRLRTDDAMTPLTAPVTFVGDTQEHEIGGLPSRAINGFVDAMNPVTIRPPQQALFGRQYFQKIAKDSESRPLIHLGDVLDISCLSEWNRYESIFKSMKQPWAIAPGNHDGIMHGIFNVRDNKHKKLAGAFAWDIECRQFDQNDKHRYGENFAHLMSSDLFITRYVSALPVNLTRADIIDYRDDKSNSFVRRLFGRIVSRDGNCSPTCGDFSRSYLVQKLKLPAAPGAKANTYLILLDTTQWGPDNSFDAPEDMSFRPKSISASVALATGINPGNRGNMLDEQFAAVRDVMKGDGDDSVYIIAGHHPFDKFTDGAKTKFISTFSTLKHPVVYISAHTHTGFWARHKIGDREILELNINSLADWPIAFRTLSFSTNADISIIRVHSFLKISEDGPNIESNDGFWAAWQDQCQTWFDGRYNAIAQKQAELVRRHDNSSMGFFEFRRAVLLKDKYGDKLPCNPKTGACQGVDINDSNEYDWLMYKDKRNDMEAAKEVIATAAEQLPQFANKLRNNVPIIPAECRAKSDDAEFADCVRKTFVFDESKAVQISERRFSEFIQQTQNVISSSTDQASQRYFSCAFAAAAQEDYRVSNTGFFALMRRLLAGDSGVQSDYYYTEMDASR